MANEIWSGAGGSMSPPKANSPGTSVDPPVTDTPRGGQFDKGVGGAPGDPNWDKAGGGLLKQIPPGKGGGGRGGGYAAPAPTEAQLYDVNTKLNIPVKDAADLKKRQQLSAELNPEIDPAQIDRVNKYDKTELVDLLSRQIEAARQQYNTQIDNSMDTQARDLNRALADAQSQFQTQQNQVSANEMNALDNAALYAEARGDRGGIGQAQYNSVQNTAAQNRLAVSQAQTKLATDTARQISDLRAQGEFERADKMLATTQQYLSELRQIEEYAANYNLSVDQINTAIAEWEYDYEQAVRQFRTNTELSLVELTGAFSNGMPTYQASQTLLGNTAQLALSLIEAGVKPTQLSRDQLAALNEYYGMGQTSINSYYKRVN